MGLARLLSPFRTAVPTDDRGAVAQAPPVALPRTPTARATEQLIDQIDDRVALLHHRRTPLLAPPMDHIAVAPCGVWIVHSRGHAGRIAARRPMFGDPRLTIGGHDRSDLLASLEQQVGYVERALAHDHPDVAVRSALLFVDTEAPLVSTPHLGSYLFFGTPSVVRHLNSDGPLRPERIQVVAELLEARFPGA
ncbi:MAG: nuclease-related domain-containing protein [Solirubrobacteraceae bacterium]|nr:nuclease-related domain-containing protein [Patulibacter sp.]